VLIVTTNDIPGWEIQRVCGEVFGLTVRSRNAFSQFGAGLKSMFGGELQGMIKNLTTEIGDVWTSDLRLWHGSPGGAGHRCREVHGESARLRWPAAAALTAVCLINRGVYTDACCRRATESGETPERSRHCP